MMKNKVDAYPWAVPTDEQMSMFDNLSYEEQLGMLRQAIIDGENSGSAGTLNMDEIRRKAKQRTGLPPS